MKAMQAAYLRAKASGNIKSRCITLPLSEDVLPGRKPKPKL